jgi:hypothetical protein
MPSKGDPELLGHFSVLVYPFRHHVLGSCRLSRLAALSSRWATWASRFSPTELATALEASGFFFPSIRGLLYPEVAQLLEHTACEDHEEWSELLHDWARQGLADLVRDLPPGVVRLTLRREAHTELEEFTAHCPAGHDHPALELATHCDWVDALLFPSGIGVLLFKLRLTAPGARLSMLVRLNHSLRQVIPLTRHASLARLEFASGASVSVRELVNYLLQGITSPWPAAEQERPLFGWSLCQDGSRPYTDTEAGRTYGERCHVVSQATVDLVGMTAAELPAGAFPGGADRLVFEYATGIELGDSVHNPTWVPSPEQAARYCRDNRVSLWRCWTGMVLKDALVFLGTEDIPFNRRSLPWQVENEYLPLYTFALYQKLQLFAFSNELLREVALAHGHLRGARALLQRFVMFRSQYWLSEVTRKPQGGDLYRTFQRGLEVPITYEMVTSSVKDVKDYYESVWARRLQWIKDAVTFGGPITVALGALRMAVDSSGANWAVGLVVVAALVALAVVALLRWQRFRPARRVRGPVGQPSGARLDRLARLWRKGQATAPETQARQGPGAAA